MSQIFSLVKSGNVSNAQQIFDMSKKKTVGIYGAMMKGEIILITSINMFVLK
jgi:hypothetical protein